MSHSTKLTADLLLGIALVAVIAGLSLLFSRFPQTIIVTRTANGFEPASISIQAGDTVTFVSTAGMPYWPASDFHPSHQLYPEFDPKRPLARGEKWSFTFERAGTWTYHDHLASQTQGTVTVTGTSKEDIATCVANSKSIVKSYCWAGFFTTIIREQGISVAFDRFAKMYAGDWAFQQNCHDIMHILGKAGYDEFEKSGALSIRPETSYCAYGFYHGFIEEMFARNGNLDLADGVRYCQAVLTSSVFPSQNAASTAAAACFHGLGHASFDSLGGLSFGDDEKMVAEALHECEGAVPEERRAQCASGVFNSLANAYSGHNYELAFRDPDPTSICRIQKPIYQLSCYGEVSVSYVRSKKYDFSSATRFIAALPAHQAGVIYSFIDDYIRHDIESPTPANVKQLCDMLSAKDEAESCVRGVVHALVATGEPGKEELKALPYCELLPAGDSLRRTCFRTLGQELGVTKTATRVKEICSKLSKDDASSCEDVPTVLNAPS